jgi:predicted RNA-binding protein with PUA-like domain
MPAHWLVKQEPTKYPFSQLLKDKKTHWDGVRNFQARNNLRAMKKADLVLYYHSVEEKAVVGIAEVTREAYPDPTAEEGDWSVVDLKPVRALTHSVALAEIKIHPKLKNIALVKQSRLSVLPVTKTEFDLILQLGSNP